MLFLSHSGADTEEAKVLANRLRESGLDVWLDVERLQPSQRSMEELENALRVSQNFAVYIGKSGVERWVDREVRAALDRNSANPEFRIFPYSGSRSGPQHIASVSPAASMARSPCRLVLSPNLKSLIGALLQQTAERVSLLPDGKPPFLGLRAFDVEDGLLFTAATAR